METFVTVVIWLSGLFLFFIGLIVSPNDNAASRVVFKLLPLLLGVACIVAGLYRIGFIIRL